MNVSVFVQEPYKNHVRQILQQLLENKLFIKGEKCKFHVETVPFLGYIIEEGNLKPDSVKVQAVAELARAHR